MIVSWSGVRPPPPYSFGNVGYSHPIFAIPLCTSFHLSLSSRLNSLGSTGSFRSEGTFSFSQVRTSWRNFSCSSVYGNAKSICTLLFTRKTPALIHLPPTTYRPASLKWGMALCEQNYIFALAVCQAKTGAL